MTCVVIVLPAMRSTILINNKKHVKYNPYVLDDVVMWNLKRNETERD